MRNRAKCCNCGDVIESVHIHDFVTCSCFTDTEDTTGIFIDGGTDYLRAGGNIKNYIRLNDDGTEFVSPQPSTKEKPKKELSNSKKTKLLGLRAKAAILQKKLDTLVEEAETITGESDRTFDFIVNNVYDNVEDLLQQINKNKI